MSWKNLRVRNKIILCFVVPIILVVIFAIWTYSVSKDVFDDVAAVKDRNIKFALLAERMSRDVVQIQQWLTDISATRGMDGLDDGFNEAGKSYQSVTSGLSQFKEMFEADSNTAGVQTVQEIMTRVDAYYDAGKKMAKAYIEGGPETGNRMMGDFDKTAEALSKVLEPFVKEQTDTMEIRMGEIIHSVSGIQTGVIIICLILISISVIIGWFISNSIAVPLNESKKTADLLANGDLLVNINEDRGDEFGQLQHAMKNMADNLKRIIEELTGLSSTVASSSEELSATTEQINSAISDQSSQLEQSSAATIEVSQTIIEVAKNASDASDAAKESVGIANEGKTVVEQTVSSMLKIAENVETSSRSIGELGESSKKIGDIIDVINDIASQTNLLALNAAIEAARAGEQGRGFAVVADEVRKLAEKTAKATEEITAMINKIQQDTDVSVQSMNKNLSVAEEGVVLASKAKESLDRIVSASERCLDQVNSIAAASEQQSSAVEEVSSSIEHIASNFMTSKEAVSQINQSAIALSQVSNELRSLISWFKTDAAKGTN